MKVDAVLEVKKMLDYLHFDYDAEELEKRLNSDYGTFHRWLISRITKNVAIYGCMYLTTILSIKCWVVYTL